MRWTAVLDDPWMLQDPIQGKTLRGPSLQETDDEITSLSGDGGGKPKVHFLDASVRLLIALAREGSLASDQLVRKDTEGPDVRVVIVRLPRNHLRWDVVGGSAKSQPL